jgi:hypothetical protein
MNALDESNLRSELDDMFRRREADVAATFALPAATKVRARIRRVATTAVSAVTVVGIVWFSVAVLGGLVGTRREALPAGGLEGATVLTRGEIDGEPWSVSAGRIDGVPCTEIQMGREVTGGCWPEISETRPSAQLEAGVHGVGQPDAPSWRRITFVVAIVPDDVARVIVRSDAGVASSRDPVQAPQEWGSAVRVAVVPIEERTSTHLASAAIEVRYLDDDGADAHPAQRIQPLEDPDVTSTSMVPDYVSHRISAIGAGTDARSLLAWQEGDTSKFGAWLQSTGRAFGMGATTEFVGDEPFLSIHRLCERSTGVVWGTVPSNVAGIEVGLVAPDRIDTIAGPGQLGDVRFVLGGFTEPYAERAPITFLDAAGRPLGAAWPSAAEPGCLE